MYREMPEKDKGKDKRSIWRRQGEPSNHNAGLTPVKGTEKEGWLDRKSLSFQHSSKKSSARSMGNLIPKLPIRTVLHPRNRLAPILPMLSHWPGVLIGNVA